MPVVVSVIGWKIVEGVPRESVVSIPMISIEDPSALVVGRTSSTTPELVSLIGAVWVMRRGWPGEKLGSAVRYGMPLDNSPTICSVTLVPAKQEAENNNIQEERNSIFVAMYAEHEGEQDKTLDRRARRNQAKGNHLT